MLARAGRYVRNGLAVTGGLVVVGGLVVSQTIAPMRKRMKEEALKLPDKFLLELDLETQEVVETVPFSPLKFLGQAPKQMELRKVVRALGEAGGDGRVQGVVAYIGAPGAGLAVMEELRAAVKDFRTKAAGRAACIAYSDTFGEAGSGGFGPYFLASAFDKVYMQPTGMVGISGLAIEGTFFGKLLDRWDVRRHFIRREEFKGAVERFTEDKHTSAYRAALDRILTSMVGTVVEGVSQSRGLPQAAVEAAIDEAPLTAQRAVALKLLDAAKYRDEAVSVAAAGFAEDGKPPARVPLSRYVRVMEAKEAEKKNKGGVMSMLSGMGGVRLDEDSDAKAAPEVAVVHATGPIFISAPSNNPTGGAVIDSIKLCKTLRQLRESKAVKAVVLRVDSPGGSAVASDVIHREVSLLKAAGKPVIVSMGNYAASGGYYISCPATRILAQPTTITGSIGVIGGKFNVAGGLNQVGVTTDIVSVGKNASAMSAYTDWTEPQRQQAEAMIDDVYEIFRRRVAEGRGLTPEATHKLAKGRVWTGADALELGLVDQLGGLQDAIALARQAAKLSEQDEAVEYPKAKSPAQLLGHMLRGEPLDASLSVGGLPAGMSSAPQAAALLLGGMSVGHSGGDSGAAAAAALAATALLAGGGAAGMQVAAAASGQAGPQMVCDITVR